MPRPKKCRFVENFPQVTIFKPSGVSMSEIDPVILGLEELEALRLADYQCKKHVEAAKIMNISRATFGRIIEKARYLVTDALINGKAIVIQGGDFCYQELKSSISNEDLYDLFIQRQKKCQSCKKFQFLNNLYVDSKVVK